MKTGVLGGTFNPPHKGHLSAAEHTREALGLEQVLFIPTNLPPHKTLPDGSATTQQRCDMVRLMTKPYDWAVFSDMEVRRGGASYTVDTLRALHTAGYDNLTLIVGTDMLMSFDVCWRAPEEIARLAALAVVARGLNDRPALHKKAELLRQTMDARIFFVECPVLTISSTEVREMGTFEQMTPPEVAAYIREHGLYHRDSE